MKLFFPAAAPLKNFPPVLLIFLIFFPIFTGYSVLRQRIARTDYLMRRGTLYAILTVLATQVYGVWAQGPKYFEKFFQVKRLHRWTVRNH